MRRSAARISLAVFLISVAGILGGVVWSWIAYKAPGPLQSDKALIIPKGLGVQEIAKILHDDGVIDNPYLFALGARYTQMARRMRAGEFAFVPGISIEEVVEHLVDGEIVTRRLTVPEGLLTRKIIEIVAGADGLTGSVETSESEGVYLPETYFYSYGDSRTAVLARMTAKMNEALADAWAKRNPEIVLKSPREALILASIIEKETGMAAERARVSAVFHNRLRRRMRLQSDPTVAYAVTDRGVSLGRPLTRADLGVDSPYNTYRVIGLPPGPIANPGRASLLAAVQPLQTREYYFVADGQGGHAFSKTLRQHNGNVAKWRQLQRQRAK